MLLQSTTITFATFIPRPAVSAIASSLLHAPICLMTSLAGLHNVISPSISRPVEPCPVLHSLSPAGLQWRH